MLRRFSTLGMVVALMLGGCRGAVPNDQDGLAEEGNQEMKSIHDFVVKSIDDKDVALADYKGKVLLIVNVASKCGFTGQYEGLQKLYKTYKDQGFLVLGFPANDFLSQEPGSNTEIQQFCTLNYGVTFPMFAKISVKGKDVHPLYAYLTSKETNPEFGGAISWNFNKFLIGADGKIAARFGSRTKPEDRKLVQAVEQAIQKRPPDA
jgi:glutathione peroxidase-family protein